MTDSAANAGATVSRERLRRFARDVLVAYGANADEADVVAEVLTWCDAAGRANQGVWRLPLFCKRLERGVVQSPCKLSIEERSAGVVAIDGGGGLGHYVAVRAMDACVERSRAAGIGAAAVRNSNFLGAVAYYVDRAARQGCIGLAFSNSFPKVAAHGGARPVLGTNPLAIAAPRADGTCFLLDMATSAAAGSTVTKAAERGEPLQDGVAVDAAGAPTNDPAAARAGALLPAAGAKGYGLALAVEILAGVVTGAGVSSGVRSMYSDFSASGDNGHLFVAIDIATLMPLESFCERLEGLAGAVANSGRADAPPGFPGDARFRALAKTARDGIALDSATVGVLRELAAARDVEPTLFESSQGAVP